MILPIAMITILLCIVLLSVIAIFFFTPADRKVLLQRPQIITVDGNERTYRTYLPKDFDSRKEYLVVIGLHELGGSGRRLGYYSAFQNIADREQFIVVYPDALKAKPYRNGWNAEVCCGSGWKKNFDDEGFIVKLIEKLNNDYNIPNDKVFLTGMSNGAVMTYKLASHHPELFAGVVGVAGSTGTKTKSFTQTSPVPILLIHGQKDEVVSYSGDRQYEGIDWHSFAETKNDWISANECDPSTVEITKRADRIEEVYKNCKAPLKVIEFKEKGHEWPDWRILNFWNKYPEGTQIIWDFFSQQKQALL